MPILVQNDSLPLKVESITALENILYFPFSVINNIFFNNQGMLLNFYK